MARFQINVEVGTKSNDKPDVRHLFETANSPDEAEKKAAKKIAKYGPSAQVISVYVA